ncbi:hypothetical protein NS115_03540 [Paenibacillus jamilae]|uniref:Uncharacterized protein n=1 Tax=Paenibacillus jamilae TaxID=114136 RepID=A0ACC5A0F8_9BACL|nr:hypothetical protein NS115_03540 [Paenibacillus jamilae]
MLTAKQRLVRGYGFAIYEDGSRKFDTVAASYHGDIKAFAAATFAPEKLDVALSTERINETEYRDTLALVGSDEAQAWVGV